MFIHDTHLVCQKMTLLGATAYELPISWVNIPSEVLAEQLLEVRSCAHRILERNLFGLGLVGSFRGVNPADFSAEAIERRHSIFQGIRDEVLREVGLNLGGETYLFHGKVKVLIQDL